LALLWRQGFWLVFRHVFWHGASSFDSSTIFPA
jgi:hypothetical protein